MRRVLDHQALHRTAHEQDNAVNLTPMLDVVFIMLIFFIVTATFIREEGLAVNPPDDNEHSEPDPKKTLIVVRISSRDRIRIAQQDVDWRAVKPVLARLHAQNPEAPVVVQSHAKARTQTMVHVMDMARLVGVSKVSLAAK